ncbi:hypothetical protein [Actinoplanes sp. NPDC089786]|uniref:hypothetical protein n=1 Tax=Actinoplanes sp. NPDC089786 TaxID=3155185 RepID=UPI00343DC439
MRRLLDDVAAGISGHLTVSGPPKSGKTAIADAAVREARGRGLRVNRAFGRLVWDDHDDGGGPRLLVCDDLDWSGADVVAELRQRSSQLSSSPTAVLVTVTGQPPGHAVDLRLAPLTPAELATLVSGLPPDAIHALWLASAGWPGTALELAAQVTDPETNDTLVELALTTASRAQFLDRDVALVRLLEEAAARPLPSTVRARVLARLARELLGDQSTTGRRRALIDEATALARAAGDPGVTAEVLDCRLHALWDPAAAAERLTVASQIVGCARAAGDAATERRGTFWRFIALIEQGELDAAEAALAAYGRAGELDGDPEAGVVVLARQAVLAIVRGRFALAESLTREVAEQGRRIGLVDTDRLTATLTGWLALLRGTGADHIPPLMEMARRFPGQFYEATAARAMAETGQVAEALLELDRLLPAVLAGDGPRWLGAAADLALVASLGAAEPSTRALYQALEPYAGRLVVWGGANMIVGPVDEYLGRLAVRQGLLDVAAGHFDRAAETAERLGALPWLASILAARGRPGDADRARDITRRLGLGSPTTEEWILRRDGTDWQLEADAETVRVRDSLGMRHLRALLAAAGREITALDLAAGGAGLRAPATGPVLDDTGRAAFRHRLARIEEGLAAADRAGDADLAARLIAERSALVRELRHATGLGGRIRQQGTEAERARVNVTRAVRTALQRISSLAPLAGAHLQASIRTGSSLRYQAAAGGPERWRL